MALYHSFTAQDGCVCLSDAHDTKPSSSECPDMTFPVALLVRSHCLAPHDTRNLQFFSQRTSACISEPASCTYPVIAYSVALFQCFRMIPVLCSAGGGGGGEQKCTKKNRTPLARSTIEPSVQNGFCRPSGKRLQLETWDINSRGIGL